MVSVESDADTVILVEQNNNANRDTEDDDGGEEETLSEASLAAAKEMIIAEVRSLSFSSDRQIITIDWAEAETFFHPPPGLKTRLFLKSIFLLIFYVTICFVLSCNPFC